MSVLTTVDPDAWRTTIRGSRHYQIPGLAKPVPSATSIKPEKVFRSTTPLGTYVSLDALRVAEAVAERRNHLPVGDPALLIEELADAPRQALRKASARGTEVHDIIAAHALGHDVPIPTAEAAGFVAAAMQFIADYDVQFLAVEVIAVVPSLDVAGTVDVIVRVGNRIVIIDWKTRGGRHGAYPEEVAQLGVYSLAEHLLVGAHPGEKHPMPDLDELAVVSLIDDGSYALYPVDLDLARDAAREMHAAWQAQQAIARHGKQAIGRPVTGQTTTPDTSTGDVGERLFAERVEWITTRVKALTPEARADAVAAWPTSAPRKGGLLVNHDQVDAIAAVLAQVEARHRLPFHTGDPATDPNKQPQPLETTTT